MANLDDSYALWQAGIYQLEQADPVLGGAPNEATGAGMDNIPHQQLARRTKFLKDTIDGAGIGATTAPLVVLNTAKASGIYRFAAADPNTPATGVSGSVIVAAVGANDVHQTVHQSGGNRMWSRYWNGAAWSAWSELWQMQGNVALLEDVGWQKLPSGLIMQWGVTSPIANNSQAVITLPLAFTNPFRAFAQRSSAAIQAASAYAAACSLSSTQITIRTASDAPANSFSFHWTAWGI